MESFLAVAVVVLESLRLIFEVVTYFKDRTNRDE